MRRLVITLAGLRGEHRRHACLMIQECGASCSDAWSPGRTTHLVCAAGDAMAERRRRPKVSAATEWNRRQAALEARGTSPPSPEMRPTRCAAIVRLGWLEACVRSWERVAEKPYWLEGNCGRAEAAGPPATGCGPSTAVAAPASSKKVSERRRPQYSAACSDVTSRRSEARRRHEKTKTAIS